MERGTVAVYHFHRINIVVRTQTSTFQRLEREDSNYDGRDQVEESAQNGPADSPTRTEPLQQKGYAEENKQNCAHAGDQIGDVQHGAEFAETSCCPCLTIRGASCLWVPSDRPAVEW